ncbi:MAG: hypothetical protein J5746_02790 [Victivallales bacterium]|nr:hypothetical protein [Victivallales bacterium]
MVQRKLSREYKYPLKVNEGTMLGNGHLGLLVWGADDVINITIGCANLWDHRGGMEWRQEQNFANIRQALQSKDVQRLKDIFQLTPKEGEPARPSIVPIGHIRIKLKAPCVAYSNSLDLTYGGMTVKLGLFPNPNPIYRDNFAEASLNIDEKEDLFAFYSKNIESWSLSPAYNSTPELKERGFSQPFLRAEAKSGYFIQKMPNEKDGSYSVSVVFKKTEGIKCSFAINKTKDELEKAISNRSLANSFPEAHIYRFWECSPQVSFEDEELQKQYDEAMFKFQNMTPDYGVPAGLQGPWIEDNRMPPWSGDYHFNINVQMCYAPALRARLYANLRKMLDMVWSWREKLKNNAKLFIGIDNGYMLPHAVDDTGRIIGGFWTGTLDHGCTAWVAQMMFDYADYTGDMEYLKNIALDFMQGAFNVYYAMMEKKDGKLSLPLSVSPEYKSANPDAWGVNASFQLAACHRLTRNLLRCAKMLKLPVDKRWKEVEEKLPEACLLPRRMDWGENEVISYEGEQEIGLWEGKYLDVSHRHHSHLAGIYPFNTIDPDDEKWAAIVRNSVARWVGKGMSRWTGWCMTWAMALQLRLGNPDTALMLFDMWRQAFLNKGGNSTHDAAIKGVFEFCGRPDIIQLDATMGALSFLQDLLMYEEGGVLHFFSCTRGSCYVKDMPAPGGFIVSGGTFREEWYGKSYCCTLRIKATRPGLLRLKLRTPPEKDVLECSGDAVLVRHPGGQVLSFQMNPNQKLTLRVEM